MDNIKIVNVGDGGIGKSTVIMSYDNPTCEDEGLLFIKNDLFDVEMNNKRISNRPKLDKIVIRDMLLDSHPGHGHYPTDLFLDLMEKNFDVIYELYSLGIVEREECKWPALNEAIHSGDVERLKKVMSFFNFTKNDCYDAMSADVLVANRCCEMIDYLVSL